MTSENAETLSIKVKTAKSPSRKKTTSKDRSPKQSEEAVQDQTPTVPLPERIESGLSSLLVAYKNWQDKTDSDSKTDALHDAVHEVRCVLAAIEIEQITDHSSRHRTPMRFPRHRSKK